MLVHSNLVIAAEGITQSKGLPQLDFSKYPQQIFWLVICFSILYLVMHYIFVPKIYAVKHKRQERIVLNIEKSTKIKKEIEFMEVKIHNSLKQAQQEAKAIIDNSTLQTATVYKERMENLLVTQRDKKIEFDHAMLLIKREFNNKLQSETLALSKDLMKVVGLEFKQEDVEVAVKESLAKLEPIKSIQVKSEIKKSGPIKLATPATNPTDKTVDQVKAKPVKLDPKGKL